MGHFHETSYLLKIELPFRKVMDLIIECLQKLVWPNPGHEQQAKTFFEKIDYKKGKIFVRKRDVMGEFLKNPYLANELITLNLQEQKIYEYKLHIKSESSASLPLGYNYENVVAIKNAIFSTKKIFQSKSNSSFSSYQQPTARPKTTANFPNNDPYQILGLHPEATTSEITEAYLKAVRSNHPDKLTGLGMAPELIQLAEERMKAINAAYEVLQKKNASL